MPTRKWGNEKIVNTTVPGSQNFAATAALVGGGFVVVWEDVNATSQSIRAQRFDAVGNKVGGEIVVSPVIANTSQFEPKVTGLADGGFYVTWDFERPPVGDQNNHDVTGKIFDPNGAFVTFMEPVPFSSEDPDTRDQHNGAVARLGDGFSSVAVFAEEFSADDQDIIASVFAEDGTQTRITVEARTGNQQEPDVAVSRSGSEFAVVWTDLFTTNPSDIMCSIFSASGTPRVPIFQVNANSAGSQFHPVVTWLDNSAFVVAWNEAFDIFARVFVFNGLDTVTPVTGNIRVNSTVALVQIDPDIVALPNGGFVIAWEDNSVPVTDTVIRLQAFDGVGGKVGQEMTVNTTMSGTQSDAQVTALADGRVVVTWTDTTNGADVRMQIVDPRDGIITGAANPELLYGHAIVDDEISGADGNDTIHGLGGEDALYGGANNDLLLGEKGDDVGFGGTGNDLFVGGKGDDEFSGESGNDVVRVGVGEDILAGGTDNDTLDFSFVNLSSGVTVALASGSFTLRGGDAQTFSGFERVIGTDFADNLTGNGGANRLTGGIGKDSIDGGGGADIFAYDKIADSTVGVAGRDAITGFVSGTDKIDVDAIDARTGAGNGGNQDFLFDGTFGIGHIRVVDSGADALIEFNTNSNAAAEMSILLKNVDHTTIDANDFIL